MGSYPNYKEILFFLITKAYKILFVSTVLTRTLISISSYSWLGIWLGLEINLISIIPLIQTKKNILSNESSIKYFIVQAIASTVILISVICLITNTSMYRNIDNSFLPLLIINSALVTKIGIAPFHFWFPEVMEGLSWLNCLLILTWQKLAPIVLLMYNIRFIQFLTLIILTSIVVRGIIGFNQVSLRKVLAYSSINHIGWIIRSIIVDQAVWIIYFIVYTVISINIVIIFKTLNVFFLNQLYQTINNNALVKLLFIINFLSLRGVPPFLGFIPKWITIQVLVINGIILLPTIIIIFTIITVFIYIRITLSTLLINTNECNWNSSIPLTKFKQSILSLINFVTIARLILVTLRFNLI